jgi:hypothetical protein
MLLINRRLITKKLGMIDKGMIDTGIIEYDNGVRSELRAKLCI